MVGCLVWFEPSANSPLDKDAGLHGVHNAPEARLLLRAPQYQTHLTREGGRQPITHLRRHRVRLDVTELILGVHQPPERERERERDRERETEIEIEREREREENGEGK